MLVDDERVTAADAGRTTTALDDRFIRFVGRLPSPLVVLLASCVYGAWGVALPLLLNVDTVWMLSFNTVGVLFAAIFFFAWLVPVIEGRLRRQQLEQTTGLRRLSAREFEEVVGELFRLEGWDVTETGGHGEADGNVDLRLRRGHERRVVQCKRWTSWDVGVDEIRKLGGALLRDGLTGKDGVIATSARFYPAAVAEAEQLGIELIDGSELVRRLDNVGAHQLLSRPSHAAWLCPVCTSPMILAHSPHGFWLRCPSFSSGCRGKFDLGSDPRAAIDKLLAAQ